MPVRAILFDVGGPIDREEISERLIDAHIREALASRGISVSDDEYAAANQWAVESFAPNAYQAIIWRLAGHDRDACELIYADVTRRGSERRAQRGGIELRASVPELLERLHESGVRLGLAANQPPAVIEQLEACGIARYFTYQGVSGTHGLRKPDPRLFVHACDALAVTPQQCVMVGDRIDNDIVPARVLGMRTVLFRTGRHIDQQPRSWEECPDVEVHSVDELSAALDVLIQPAKSG